MFTNSFTKSCPEPVELCRYFYSRARENRWRCSVCHSPERQDSLLCDRANVWTVSCYEQTAFII